MKRKISISVDDETLIVIQRAISSKRFRNRSHAVEFAIQQLEQAGERSAQETRDKQIDEQAVEAKR